MGAGTSRNTARTSSTLVIRTRIIFIFRISLVLFELFGMVRSRHAKYPEAILDIVRARKNRF